MLPSSMGVVAWAALAMTQVTTTDLPAGHPLPHQVIAEAPVLQWVSDRSADRSDHRDDGRSNHRDDDRDDDRDEALVRDGAICGAGRDDDRYFSQARLAAPDMAPFRDRLTAEGYQPLRAKCDDGQLEFRASRDGRVWEIKMSADGRIIEIEAEDD